MINIFYCFSFFGSETKPKMEMTRLETSGVLHFEIRTVQLKILFLTDGKYNQIDTITEEDYCILDNIEFYITKNTSYSTIL